MQASQVFQPCFFAPVSHLLREVSSVVVPQDRPHRMQSPSDPLRHPHILQVHLLSNTNLSHLLFILSLQ